MTELKIYRMYEGVELPQFATEGSACFDLQYNPNLNGEDFTYYDEYNQKRVISGFGKPLVIYPGYRIMIPTGLKMDIPKGYSVRIYARSGLSLTQGLNIINSVGIIDSDYVQQVYVLMHNNTNIDALINPRQKIAQAELIKSLDYVLTESIYEPQRKTSRDGGFGSTDKVNNDLPNSITKLLNVKEHYSEINSKHSE